MNRNRNNNRNRRFNNNRNQRPNRGANRAPRGAATPSRPDLLVQRRVFTRDFTSICDESSGVQLKKNLLISTALDQYTAYQSMPLTYDQYKITCIEVFAKIFAPNISTTTDPVTAAMLAYNSTEITSAVDLDSTAETTLNFIKTYTNAKSISLGPRFKRIGKFQPRPTAADLGMIGVVPNQNMWLNTRSSNIRHLGLQTQIDNNVAGQYFGVTGNDGFGIQVRVRAHVAFRGRRVDPGILPIQAITADLRTETEHPPAATAGGIGDAVVPDLYPTLPKVEKIIIDV